MGTVRLVLAKNPVVALTLVVLAAVLVLLGTGSGGVAQWVASSYVVAIVIVTAVGMVRDILRGHWGLDILAVVAMVATVAVGEYVAGLIIVLMLSGGEALEDFAARRARSELTALLDRAPRTARRLTDDGVLEDVDVAEVRVGDQLLVRPAEVVPVDGELLDEAGVFDESSLTGESLPVERLRCETLMSGAVNGEFAVRMRATASAEDSQYQRILALVAEAYSYDAISQLGFLAARTSRIELGTGVVELTFELRDIEPEWVVTRWQRRRCVGRARDVGLKHLAIGRIHGRRHDDSLALARARHRNERALGHRCRPVVHRGIGDLEAHQLAAAVQEVVDVGGQVEADDALVAIRGDADGLERAAARNVDRGQHIAVVEQALIAPQRPPAPYHLVQPRHVFDADIRRQAQLSQRAVSAAPAQAGKVDGGWIGHAAILAFRG
mgnify:CR=1 FL=1